MANELRPCGRRRMVLKVAKTAGEISQKSPPQVAEICLSPQSEVHSPRVCLAGGVLNLIVATPAIRSVLPTRASKWHQDVE